MRRIRRLYAKVLVSLAIEQIKNILASERLWSI